MQKRVFNNFLLSFIVFLCFCATGALAQISIPNTSPVTENFNSMGAVAGASLPANWKMSSAGNGVAAGWATGSNVTVTTQAASSGSPTTGGRYNWATSAGTDRCAGFMTSGSYANSNCIMAYYQNNTGATITDLAIAFQIERYRINTSNFSLTFFTSTDGIAWTSQAAGDIAAGVFATGASSYTFASPQTQVKSFSLLSVNIAASGAYYLKWVFNTSASNSQGVGLDDVSVTATTCTFPTITSQPSNSSVCAGNNSSFSVTATGATGYQWEEYNGSVWSTLVNGGVYSNVTAATLDLTGVIIGMNNYQYRCIISSAGCPITSNAATLSIGGAFSIVTQPSNATTCIGNNASFSVAATAGVTVLQWQVSTDGGLSFSNLSNGAPYSGVTTGTLNITGAGAGMNGYMYQCVLSNGGCTAPATSNAVTLTVGGPTFISNPGNAATCTNGAVFFDVVTSGVAPTYVWEFSTDGGFTWNPVPGAVPYSGINSATLNINPAAIGMNGYQYRCVATDAGCPSTSTAAVLTVSNGPVIFTQPSNVITPAGTNAVFSVNAANVSSYQWEENTGAGWVALTNTPPYSGVTSASLTISGVTVAMNGYLYRCVLNGCSSSLTSNQATLIIGVASGTTLLPGDLVFVGYDSKVGTGAGCTTGASTDRYYIVNMVDLTPGTKFKIVNSRFESGAAAGVRTNRWYGPGDDPYQNLAYAAFTWNGLSNIAKGSIITVNVSGDIPNSVISNIAINGTPTANFSVSSIGSCNISSTAPDQVYLVQGDFISLGTPNVDLYNIFTGKVLFGLTNARAWVPLSNACSAGIGGINRESRLPDDIECFNLESAVMREVYFYLNSSLHNGSQRQLLGAIMTPANWSQPGSSNCLDIVEDWTGATGTSAGKQFTFIAGNQPGYWIGDFNTDWFNCRNWESFTVPDPTVDVTIPALSINDCYVDVSAFPVTAAKYGNVAQCKNLSVSARNLVLQSDINDKLTSYGNLLISGSGNIDMDDGNNAVADGQIYLIGNWTNQLSETNFDEGNSTIHFLGAGIETISTSPVDRNENFYNTVLDNASGFVIDGDVTVQGNMNMINGIVNPVSLAVDEVIFTDNATVTNLTANSYVAGKVKKAGDDGFVFPTGKSGKWARIAMSPPASVTSEFQAEYFKIGYGIYLVNLPLDHVSTMEYWNLNTLATPSNVAVTLYWEDGVFSGITGPLTPDLRVAHFNGTAWDDNGNTAITGAVPAGTVRSFVPVNAFGSFTFGSITPQNPLPIELISFTAKAVENKKVILNWITQTEINNDYFILLRSKDGLHFENIAQIEGHGTTTSVSHYEFTDENPLPGVSYYKLRQVDFNSDSFETEMQSVSITKGNITISAHHVSSNELQVSVFSKENQNMVIELYDISGKLLYHNNSNVTAGYNQLIIFSDALQKGICVLRVYNTTENFVMKVF